MLQETLDSGGGTRELRVSVVVNGERREADVPARQLLSDFLRHDLGLTGTHVGCEHGVCGACTVLVDGRPARACLTLAAQVEGAEITTVEGIADGDELHPVQEALSEHHGLQCGFCTPGFVIRIVSLLEDNPRPSREEIVDELAGNLCRCTGYQGIIAAVEDAAARMAGDAER